MKGESTTVMIKSPACDCPCVEHDLMDDGTFVLKCTLPPAVLKVINETNKDVGSVAFYVSCFQTAISSCFLELFEGFTSIEGLHAIQNDMVEGIIMASKAATEDLLKKNRNLN